MNVRKRETEDLGRHFVGVKDIGITGIAKHLIKGGKLV
jgi:UDP-N-acetylmuramate-alanine ligase